MLFDSPFARRILWGATALLLLLAFIIPRLDFTPALEVAHATSRPDLFDDETIAAEALLRSDELRLLSPQEAQELLPLLKARALTASGPMTPQEIQIALEILDEYQPQIASQPTAASRATLRRHRNSLILDYLPRQDRLAAFKALDEVLQAYIQTFGHDPSEPPEE